MKIAFVYDAIYPYRVGGVEKRVWELAKRLAGEGHAVHLFGMQFWSGSRTLQRDGVTLHGVCRAHPLYSKRTGRRRVLPPLWFGIRLVIPLLREKFDVIDCQNFPYFPCLSAKMVAAFRRSPLVITWHEIWGPYWFDYLGRAGSFGLFLEKAVASMGGVHVAVSETTRRQLEGINRGRKPAVVPNGIDPVEIRDTPASPVHADIIYSGRFIREKHIEIIIGSVALLRDEMPALSCILVGDGPERERIARMAVDMGVSGHVRLLPFFPRHSDLIGLMKSSRVFVLPSVREGFGIVALEALACGLPVVTANHPANAARDFAVMGPCYLSGVSVEDFSRSISMVLQGARPEPSGDLVSRYSWENIYRDIYYPFIARLAGKS
jgi:glycosyltransferase involved in cell wall biosynthesis